MVPPRVRRLAEKAMGHAVLEASASLGPDLMEDATGRAYGQIARARKKAGDPGGIARRFFYGPRGGGAPPKREKDGKGEKFFFTGMGGGTPPAPEKPPKAIFFLWATCTPFSLTQKARGYYRKFALVCPMRPATPWAAPSIPLGDGQRAGWIHQRGSRLRQVKRLLSGCSLIRNSGCTWWPSCSSAKIIFIRRGSLPCPRANARIYWVPQPCLHASATTLQGRNAAKSHATLKTFLPPTTRPRRRLESR